MQVALKIFFIYIQIDEQGSARIPSNNALTKDHRVKMVNKLKKKNLSYLKPGAEWAAKR